MKKIIISIVVVTVVIFGAFSFWGGKEVLSNIKEPAKIEPEIEEEEEKTVEVFTRPSEPEKQPEEEIVEEPKDDLTYAEVVQLIENDQKKTVDDPDELLVLVNKNNNLADTYTPQDLVKPNVPFSFSGDDPKMYLRRDAALALEKLITKAAEEGIHLNAVSGYRSYDRQKAIFLANVKKYGFKKANTFSAVPGQSEHQTGLAMDVSASSVGNGLVIKFGETAEGIWLKENAHLFGFIIRYPREKVAVTQYQYEPWHIRYVGIEPALRIKSANLTLEEYLGEA
ncbi:MAG: M15 family metallopeptidase [Peptococcaceae bacterium]